MLEGHLYRHFMRRKGWRKWRGQSRVLALSLLCESITLLCEIVFSILIDSHVSRSLFGGFYVKLRHIRRSLREKSVSAWEAELKQMLSSNSRSEAVHRAAPSSGLVRCYVKRVTKGFFGSHCTFQVFLDNGNVFLLAARRRKKSKTSAYVISQDLEDLKRDSGNCVAKVRDG